MSFNTATCDICWNHNVALVTEPYFQPGLPETLYQ